MGFVSILKAIGKGLGIFQALAPVAITQTSAVVKVESEVEKIAQLVGTAESVGQQVTDALATQGSGSVVDVSLAKAKALLPSVEAILKASSIVSGKHVADEARFTQGAQKVLDGLVDVLDSIEHTTK